MNSVELVGAAVLKVGMLGFAVVVVVEEDSTAVSGSVVGTGSEAGAASVGSGIGAFVGSVLSAGAAGAVVPVAGAGAPPQAARHRSIQTESRTQMIFFITIPFCI